MSNENVYKQNNQLTILNDSLVTRSESPVFIEAFENCNFSIFHFPGKDESKTFNLFQLRSQAHTDSCMVLWLPWLLRLLQK